MKSPLARSTGRRWVLDTALVGLNLAGSCPTIMTRSAPTLSKGMHSTAVRASLRSIHGEAADDTRVSWHDLAEEVAGTHRG